MRKLLLVEDDKILREAYCMVLSTGPYKIDLACNGNEALDKCRGRVYDLILLDLMMPILDGVGFLEQFTRTHGKLPTKIIVLSNLSSGTDLEKAMKLGMYKSLLKADLSPSQLLAMVRRELDA